MNAVNFRYKFIARNQRIYCKWSLSIDDCWKKNCALFLNGRCFWYPTIWFSRLLTLFDWFSGCASAQNDTFFVADEKTFTKACSRLVFEITSFMYNINMKLCKFVIRVFENKRWKYPPMEYHHLFVWNTRQCEVNCPELFHFWCLSLWLFLYALCP